MSQSTDDIRSEPAASAEADFLSGFIPEEEYAQRRGVTVRTCQRDRQLRKSPPYVRVGRRIFYRIETVREWLVGLERQVTLVPQNPRARSQFRRQLG